MDKYIGRLLDNRYEILEVIGTGGMAVVYKAHCHRLNRLVAIKILKDDFLEDEDFRRRFHAESQAVAMLSHPNIVSVYDVSTSISVEADYIVMELIEGITLKQYMEKKGVLNWKETLHFAMQIAKALEHAHSRGIVHRDIKPHNVMVLKNGSVKVADFGIARMMSKGDTLTKEALGSVHYISPEQAKGGRVDNRSDIYSLGVVMYEMMTGRPPYEGDAPVAVAIQHINGGAVMPSTLNPNIPGGMEQIIMKAMANDLSDRYPTATQMLTDMDEFRKDPTLLFDYNIPPLDEVTRLRRDPLVLETNVPKTDAQKVEERAQAHRNRRAAEKTPPPRKREPATDSRSSRVATAAIIACSVVALIAIGVFLVILLGGGITGGNPNTVEVPQLVGKYYDALKAYPGLKIQVDNEVYDSSSEAGQIINQLPSFGSPPVEEGTVIHITLSKGPEPQSIMMQNLVDLPESRAIEILDSQSLGLKYEIKEENHETIIAGNVIRTDPPAESPLSSGQTVTLWVSLGAEDVIEEKKMPNLVGQKLDMAINILKAYGFPEPEFEDVYSYQDVGIVVGQSEDKDTKIPINTVITLQVSKGPEPTTEPPTTEPPTTEPPTTEPPTTAEPESIPTEEPTEEELTTAPPEVLKNVTIDLSGEITQDNTQLVIMRDGVEVYNGTVSTDTPNVVLYNQSGYGTVSYEVYLDGELKWTEKVTFTTDE